MILSALGNSLGGIVSPICLAVLRLITSSNFVGCSTGNSAGFDAEARFAVSSSFLASQILESGYKGHKKNLWPPLEKNIGRHTVSDVSVTVKVVEVTATRQRERRLKSNQFD